MLVVGRQRDSRHASLTYTNHRYKAPRQVNTRTNRAKLANAVRASNMK